MTAITSPHPVCGAWPICFCTNEKSLLMENPCSRTVSQIFYEISQKFGCSTDKIVILGDSKGSLSLTAETQNLSFHDAHKTYLNCTKIFFEVRAFSVIVNSKQNPA